MPEASTAIPLGLLNCADVPCPSTNPAIVASPTKVETIPSLVTFLIQELKSSIT